VSNWIGSVVLRLRKDDRRIATDKHRVGGLSEGKGTESRAMAWQDSTQHLKATGTALLSVAERRHCIAKQDTAMATLRTAHQGKAWQGICTSERCGGIDEDSAGKHGQSVGDEKRGDGLHRRSDEGQSAKHRRRFAAHSYGMSKARAVTSRAWASGTAQM
jgi:hypothetical protein